MLKIKTTTQTVNWESKLRPRVGVTVSYNFKTWVNVTGANSEPNLASKDWVISSVSLSRPIVTIFGNTFVLVKNPLNNNDLNSDIIEVNDIVIDGWYDSTEYWKEAIFIGTDTSVKEDWNILNSIEEIETL